LSIPSLIDFYNVLFCTSLVAVSSEISKTLVFPLVNLPGGGTFCGICETATEEESRSNVLLHR